MENLTFKINGLEFEVEKQMTTLKGVRTIVSYAIEKYNLDKKTANLTLPNGAIIKVKTLNNTKLFEAMLLPSIVLLDKEDESNLEIIEALDLVRKKVLRLPLNWDNVGNVKLGYGAEIYTHAIDLVQNEGVISEDMANGLKGRINRSLERLGKK
jgi:hypothetical protein